MKRSSLEIGCFALLTLFVLFSFRAILFLGTSGLPHDNLYWGYPLFHHYAESLLNGQLPLWNPYEHGGEPFYPILISGRFLDPLYPLAVLVGGLFTRDTAMLFHWSLFLQAWVSIVGSYLFLRALMPTLWVRLAALPVLFFSIFLLGWMRQPGLIMAFAWVPFIAYFLLRLTYLNDRRWVNWILLGAFVGMNFQFYYFVVTWLILLFFVLGLILFHRKATFSFFQPPGQWKKPALTLVIAGLMVAPNAALYLSQGDFVFPARMMSVLKRSGPAVRGPINHEGGPDNLVSAVHLPYSVLAYTGTVACVWDYLQALLPEPAFRHGGTWHGSWRIFHDGHGYIGALVWALACAGFFFFRASFLPVALFGLGALSLYTLGPGGGLHRFLYVVFPPAQLLRHTVLLVASVYLFLLIPFLGGLEYFFRLSRRETSFPKLQRRDLFLIFAVVLGAALAWIVWHPEQEDRAWFPLAFAATVGWSLRKKISPLGYWMAVTLAPLCVAIAAAANPLAASLYTVALLGLPLASLFSRRAWVAMGLVLGLLLLDFGASFSLQSLLWESKPHPSILGVNPLAQTPRLPVTRRLFAPGFSRNPQSVRYLATFFREPTIFSTPYQAANDFAGVLKVARWNSYLLPRNYFELIHSGLPGPALERMFGLERKLIQYKQGAIEAPDSAYTELFPQGESRFLDSFVLVPPGTTGLPIFGATVDLAGNQFSYRAKEYQHGDVTIEVTSAKAGILYFADGYDPSWKAFIDGKSVPVIRANKNFKALALPAGDHEVHFVYRPWSFLIAAGIFYFVFFLSLISVAVAYCRVRFQTLKLSPASLVDHSC